MSRKCASKIASKERERVKIAQLSYEEFLENKSLWNNTLQRSVDNNLFLTWEWLSNWWKHYKDNREFLLVYIADGDKMLAAAPLMGSEYRSLGMKENSKQG